jgi:hypothetical protein
MVRKIKLDGSAEKTVSLDEALKIVFAHLATVPDGAIAIQVLKRFLGG